MSKEALRGEIAALREAVEALRAEVAALRLENVAHHCQAVIYQPYQIPGAAGRALPLIFGPNTCAQPPLYMQSVANTGAAAPPPSTCIIALAGNAN